MIRSTAAGLLVVTALVAVTLLAEEPAKPAQERGTTTTAAAREVPQFSALDVNADTMISAEEAKASARLSAIFAECDADKNGALSTWEFAEARSKLDK
ncbi:MAG TPA: hypothetical protein VFO82_01325 [Steroidobacteraceae bacterium]|nr:hypothetical protein [Steroidobacteraceae bacterium]